MAELTALFALINGCEAFDYRSEMGCRTFGLRSAAEICAAELRKPFINKSLFLDKEHQPYYQGINCKTIP